MTGGIILCGGESSRMGRPKAWLPVGDELLLQRVVRVVGEAVGPVVVVAADGQAVPPLPGNVEVVRDAVPNRGPLEGLLAGLNALDGRVDAVYLSACDMPFLKLGFVRRVVECLLLPPPGRGEGGGGGRLAGEPTPHPNPPPQGGREQEAAPGENSFLPLIAVPRVGGRRHPLAAAYRVSVREEAVKLLATRRAGPVHLFDAVPTRYLGPEAFADVDPACESLKNVNTPDEYHTALERLATTSQPQHPAT